MKSTGEVLGIDKTFEDALLKGLVGAGYSLRQPTPGKCVILTVKDADKRELVDIAWQLKDMGYKLYGTSGTAYYLGQNMVACNEVRKLSEARPNIMDLFESGLVDYVISTSSKGRIPSHDSVKMRRKAVELSIPCLTAIDTARVRWPAQRGKNAYISTAFLVDVVGERKVKMPEADFIGEPVPGRENAGMSSEREVGILSAEYPRFPGKNKASFFCVL